MEPLGYGDRAGHDLDAVFAALADPTRRALLERLARGEATVTELAAPPDLSPPAVPRHRRGLAQAGLVSVAGAGPSRPRRLGPAPRAEASAWLERYREYWEASYARLDALLADLRRQRGS